MYHVEHKGLAHRTYERAAGKPYEVSCQTGKSLWTYVEVMPFARALPHYPLQSCVSQIAKG